MLGGEECQAYTHPRYFSGPGDFRGHFFHLFFIFTVQAEFVWLFIHLVLALIPFLVFFVFRKFIFDLPTVRSVRLQLHLLPTDGMSVRLTRVVRQVVVFRAYVYAASLTRRRFWRSLREEAAICRVVPLCSLGLRVTPYRPISIRVALHHCKRVRNAPTGLTPFANRLDQPENHLLHPERDHVCATWLTGVLGANALLPCPRVSKKCWNPLSAPFALTRRASPLHVSLPTLGAVRSFRSCHVRL